jgi:hypothetical protein
MACNVLVYGIRPGGEGALKIMLELQAVKNGRMGYIQVLALQLIEVIKRCDSAEK